MARTKSGRAPGAPKPKIGPAKTPISKRRGFRWGVYAALGLIVLFVVVQILGQTGRTRTLRAFDGDLQEALQPFSQHLEQSAPQPFSTFPSQFTAGSVTPQDFQKAATRWQTDFTEAAAKVRALTPPVELGDANEQIATAMDNYAALARLYGAEADLKIAIQKVPAKQRQDLTAKLTALDGQIAGMKTSADALLNLGMTQVEDLKARWGIKTTTQPQPGLSDLPLPT